MKCEKYIFNVEIADTVLQMVCRFEANMRFMQDYRTDEKEETVIAPEQSYLDQILADYESYCERTGKQVARPDSIELENIALRNMTANYLINKGILLFHASAVVCDGKCHLFAAKSGTGKSTHAMLWKEVYGDRVYVLNDDKPLVRVEGDGAEVFGSPWRGKHERGINASAPLASITFLEQAAENRIERVKGDAAFQKLYLACYRPIGGDAMAKVLQAEQRLIATVPMYQLYCRPDREAVEVAYKELQAR